MMGSQSFLLRSVSRTLYANVRHFSSAQNNSSPLPTTPAPNRGPKKKVKDTHIGLHQRDDGSIYIDKDWFMSIRKPFEGTWLGLQRYLRARRRKYHIEQRMGPNVEGRPELGPELDVSHFFVRHGARVMFTDTDRWYTGEATLPNTHVPGISIEALDLTGIPIIPQSLARITQLSRIKYLSVAGCLEMNEWGTQYLSKLQSLLQLDMSRCPLITDRALTPLSQLPNLRRLTLCELPALSEEALADLQERLPECVITT